MNKGRAMKESLHYGFIGAGNIGQALGAALRAAKCQVDFWDSDPSLCTIKSQSSLAEQCSVIILAIPSSAVRSVLSELKPHLSPSHIVLIVAKGVETGFTTMDQVCEDELGANSNYGFLYGPMLAGEVKAGQSGYGILATEYIGISGQIVTDLANGHVFVHQSDKVRDAVLCAALKNIYALGLGIADGIQLGINAKAQLTVAMLIEMRDVLINLQLDGNMVFTSCGLGDLLATGWGDASYNHRVGEAIGEGATSGLGGEGLNSLMELPSVVEISNFPILNSLHHIIISKAPAEQLSGLIR